nr:DUF2442 domain-containing protein [Eggerthella lenta]
MLGSRNSNALSISKAGFSTAVSLLGGCLLLLEFETGELRRLDVSSFLKRGGAYERLRDDEYLKLVRIIDGGMALGWPDGQEVYPEALFAMSERVR